MLFFDEITTKEGFQLSSPNPIGTNLTREPSSEYIRRDECSQADVDARG